LNEVVKKMTEINDVAGLVFVEPHVALPSFPFYFFFHFFNSTI